MKASLEVATGGSFYECAKLTTTTEPELQLYNISNQSAWPGCANSSSALDAGLWAGAETATCPDGLNCTEMQCQVKMSDPDEVVSFMQSDCGAARILFSWQHGWLKILPALPIGIPMYVLKRLHIGQPKNWMPIFIIVPNVAAYLFMGSLGKLDGLSPVAELRSCGDRTTDCPNGNYNWFFAALDEHDFTAAYDHWDRGKVRWDAIEQSYPVLLLMIIIVNIDCMLKLAGTEKQLQISIDMNHEMAVSSLGNFFSAICFAPPGYGQTKFAVLNFAIVRDTANRLPSVVCALFNAAMYFTGFPLVNYMPRFFLAGLLIFAGAGFVVENLWDSRLTLALSEYLTIWAIVLCNVVTGLLPAIILGIVLSAVTFSTKASRTNVVRFAVTRKAFQSKVIRSPWVEWKLQNLGDQVHVMKLQGFVFFGTASRLLARVQSMLGLRAQWKRPEGQIVDGKWTPTWLNPPEVEAAHEMRYLILDFEAVSDLDSTGMFAFTKLQRLTKAHGVIVLFTGLTPRLQEMMIERNGIVSRRFYLPTLDAAVEYAEELVLRWAADVRSNWYRVPEVRAAQPSIWVTSMSTACLRDLFPRDSISITRLLSYCTKQSLPPAAVLLREGERRQQLYITVVGSIKAHSTQGTTDAQARHVATVSAHAFINDDGFCLGAPIDATYTAQEECKLLSIDAEAFARMRSRDPDVAMALQQALITSILGSRDRLQLEMRALLFNAQDEVEDEVQDMRASDLFSKEGLKGIGSKAQDNLVALKSLAGDVAGTIGSTAAAGVKNVGQVASPHSPRSPRQSAADGGNGRAEAMDNPLSNYSAESSYV
jgi:CRP-like cAMP-binding protein